MIVPWSIIESALDFHGDGEGRSRQGIRPHVSTFLAQRGGSYPESRSDHVHVRRRSARMFKRVRWSDNNGEPSCPHCVCLTVYTLAETPPRWKCSGCRRNSRSPRPRSFILANYRYVITSRDRSAGRRSAASYDRSKTRNMAGSIFGRSWSESRRSDMGARCGGN
jgi:hypothetical protein